MARILIAVDIQNGFVTKHSAHVPMRLQEVLSGFDEVIWTKFYNPEPSPFRRILNYHKMSRNGPDTRLAISPPNGALVIEHAIYSCVNHELHQKIRELNCEKVFVAGIASEACVLKTVIDLFEHDIKPVVLADLCASDKNPIYHHMAIELIRKLIGPDQVTYTGDFLAVSI